MLNRRKFMQWLGLAPAAAPAAVAAKCAANGNDLMTFGRVYNGPLIPSYLLEVECIGSGEREWRRIEIKNDDQGGGGGARSEIRSVTVAPEQNDLMEAAAKEPIIPHKEIRQLQRMQRARAMRKAPAGNATPLRRLEAARQHRMRNI